jgi:tetratricopeptide (TPR) repeat protein
MAETAQKAEVCLTQIVKNEGRIIARCLRAARPHITCWSICDTGSTDDTVEIIRRELDGIPGRIVHVPWKNFGHNRSESFRHAQAYLREQGAADRAWCLLLDADHELESHGFSPEDLTADSHMLVQRSGFYRYPNIRLVRASIDWRCLGVTHEFWAGGSSQTTLPTLEIIDHEDGGTRPEKLVRDEALLRQGLADEPDNDRYHFYLAQTLEECGKRDEAIELYRKRAAMGGYGEERWMAQYRMARLMLAVGRHQEGEAELARAWQQAPHRAEPLYWLAQHHRLNSRSYLAMMYAEKAASIPLPGPDALFVENHVYQWGPQEEIAISAFYTHERDKGRRANELCIVEPATRELALKNQGFYAYPLEGVVEHGNYSEIPNSLRTFDGLEYRQGTTSILDGLVSTRVMSYDQKGGNWFKSRCADDKFRTETVLEQNGARWLVDASLEREMWPQEARILGLEDWRLFRHAGRVWFVANCCTTPEGGGAPQVALGRLSEDLRKVDRLLAPRYLGGQSWCEKNWQPLPEDVAARFAPEGDWIGIVYAYDPFTVIYVHAETGEVYEAKRGPEVCRARWRGSAPPIDLGGVLVGIVHDVSYFDSGNIYTHRFVAMSPELELVAYSPSFIFEKRGIEYTAGMQLDSDGLVRVVYTVEEHESRWLKLSVESIISQLKYAPLTGKETVDVTVEHSLDGSAVNIAAE